MKKVIKILILLFVVGGVLGGYIAYQLYHDVKNPNVDLQGEQSTYIYIPSESSYATVEKLLEPYLQDKASFNWVAEKKNYPQQVKPGKYQLVQGMSNNSLVNMLRSGRQTPVKLVFNKVRTKDVFAGIIARQIEADSVELLDLLNQTDFLQEFGKNPETAMTLFIPNTYELYWNTSANSFVTRMAREAEKFWTDTRKNKAEKMGLSLDEVFTLASIVEEETIKADELNRVAGVYVNRLQKGMRLQADPTVRFALGDFAIKRILTKHLQIKSPYNTYRVAGLPPGPICLPAGTTIDAVLNYEKHKYLYFCAKADFSGYHAFARTLSQHNENARQYQQELNKKRIYR